MSDVGRMSAWWSIPGSLVLAASLGTASCTRVNPIYADEQSDASTGDGGSSTERPLPGAPDSSTGAGGGYSSSGHGSGTLGDDAGSVGASGTTDDSTTTTMGGVRCDRPPPEEPTAYRPCADGPCEGQCLTQASAGPVEFDLSVCAIDCQDTCDCPAAPPGRGAPICEEDRCVLGCTHDESCSPGMMCTPDTGRCMWPRTYGDCQDCTGGCVSISAVDLEVCAPYDCWAGGALEASLCPPSPAGSAVPSCWEPPRYPGEGWCLLACRGGIDCPLGMECFSDGYCYHPVP